MSREGTGREPTFPPQYSPTLNILPIHAYLIRAAANPQQDMDPTMNIATDIHGHAVTQDTYPHPPSPSGAPPQSVKAGCPTLFMVQGFGFRCSPVEAGVADAVGRPTGIWMGKGFGLERSVVT